MEMEDSQDLRNELQALRAEMAAMRQENQTLRQMITQGAMSTSQAERSLAHTTPIRFDGDPRRVSEFCNYCRIHFLFKSTHFNNDKAKIGYILGNLTGNALAWVTPFVISNSPILNDFAAFEKAFLEVFQTPNLASAAQNQLMDFKQGSADIHNLYQPLPTISNRFSVA
ncbi:protein LDOC1-like [Ambystoma mexicanum]|uniref:protein LDOC1-like n=1 Tax=Ambystoma mexicanum TaxID=8296 RepID=UPI0037E75EE3